MKILTQFKYVLIVFAVMGCSIKEDPVEEKETFGLYKRSFYGEEEFICIKEDHTYEYFLKSKHLDSGKWNYNLYSGNSVIGLAGLSYSMALEKYSSDSSGMAIPIKYSHAKKVILLRINADDHSQDFIKIDSKSCSFDPKNSSARKR